MGTKIFIVDDHYMIIEGIRSLLQNEKSIEWLGHAGNAASCMAFLLSTYNQVSFIEKMISNGASGYVLKNATQQELMEAIETVLKGKQYLSFDVAQSLTKSARDNPPILTRREKEVIELIANGLTNNEIAQKLFISSTTVDTHRKNLLAKFDAKNSAELVKLAHVGRFL